MNISMDFDDTYTRDPAAWDRVIEILRLAGHTVYVITMRHRSEGKDVEAALAGKVDGIYYTGRRAKEAFMYAQRIRIDVWIDDSPNWILNNAIVS